MKNIDKDVIFLAEDHHEAYYAWKKRGFHDLTLVHIDAHLDFGFQEIKEPVRIIEEAESTDDIKNQLEKLILFEKLKLKKERLTTIGNFIYPAMVEGIVKDLYWVIPGDVKEFRLSLNHIKSTIEGLSKEDPKPKSALNIKEGLIQTRLYGRKFIVCCLETLPRIKEDMLLDIDADFFVINSIRKSDSADKVGVRKIWITPQGFIRILRTKISKPSFVTIAYSVNGGYTPIVFKYLGDEIISRLKGVPFKKPKAHIYFNMFDLLWKGKKPDKAKLYYKKAIRFDKTYRVEDNNYGPLFFAKKRYKKAEAEFKKILFADPINKPALCGMGEISLARRKYKLAKKYFKKALSGSPVYPKPMLGLGRTYFESKNYRLAEKFILRYQSSEPMQPFSHYLLGQIYEKKSCFLNAIEEYQNSIRLGLDNPEGYLKLLRLAKYSDVPSEIFDDIGLKFERFRKDFLDRQRSNLKNHKKAAEIKGTIKKINLVANALKKILHLS